MEKLDFIQKPIDLAKTSERYLWSLWETEIEISKVYASIASLFSSIFDTLSNLLVQQTILNMAVYELAFNRLTFLPDYGLSVRTVEPEQEYVPLETQMPESPVFSVLLVKKLAADLARRLAGQTPKRAPIPETTEPAAVTEELKGEAAKRKPTGTPFQTVAGAQSQLESGLAPSMKGFASAFRAYSNYAVSLAPLSLFLGASSSETVRRYPSVPSVGEELPKSEPAESSSTRATRKFERHEEKTGTPPLLQSTPTKTPIPEVSSPIRQAMELPAVIGEGGAEVMPTSQFTQALSLPRRLALVMEEISPSLASWVYGESEALRSTGLSLSAVPVAASTAQRTVAEALVEPSLGGEGASRLGWRESLRLPSVFSSLVAAHARRYPGLQAEPFVYDAYPLPSRAETPYQGKPAKEGVSLAETSVSRLPSIISLAAAESLIAQRLQHEMTTFVKDVQTARLTYGESLATMGATGPVRTTKLGELAAAPAFPIPMEPYTPAVPSSPPSQTRQRLVDRPIRDTINLTVSADTQEEDLRELERKINKILSEQLSRYYGSTRI